MATDFVIELVNISKSFPGVTALQDVSLRVRAGEIHALVGENGAGKSTLLKIMFGIEQKDAGEIRLRGQAIAARNPSHAQALGISLVHQELQLIPELNATQNIFLGREQSYPGWLFVNQRKSEQMARALLAKIGLHDFDLRRPVRLLSVAQRQMIEIAKALLGNASVIAFDEPTSSLSIVETERLFSILRELRAQGVGIIYVSHRLEEIMSIADRVTVLRDGRLVDDVAIEAVDQQAIVQMMVGRALADVETNEERQTRSVAVHAAQAQAQNEVLRVVGLTDHKKLKPASFTLYGGEILGIAGLVGSGRTELMRALFAADRASASGEVFVHGKLVKIRQPADAIQSGIGFLPEDRKIQGLLRELSLKLNVTIPSLQRMSRFGWMKRKLIDATSQQYVNQLNIVPPNLERRVRNLSGGNQQKVVLAKWLCASSSILIFDEPTRGIDVGAKADIYHLMDRLTAQGKSIIMVSSELPEILRMSHRILVMREGAVVKELARQEATQATILYYATGGQ